MLVCFDRDFCLTLEFHLTRTMQNFDNNILKYYWCDGVKIPPNNELRKNVVVQNRKIITQVYFGPSHDQNIYEMVINLGDKARKLCQKDLRLEAALPPDTSVDWVKVHPDQLIVELQLL